MLGIDSATISAVADPIKYCPGVPMLNNPVLNASATDKPVNIKGVALKSISPISLPFHPYKRFFEASRPVLKAPKNIN